MAERVVIEGMSAAVATTQTVPACWLEEEEIYDAWSLRTRHCKAVESSLPNPGKLARETSVLKVAEGAEARTVNLHGILIVVDALDCGLPPLALLRLRVICTLNPCKTWT
jgi:hypothetical protein